MDCSIVSYCIDINGTTCIKTDKFFNKIFISGNLCVFYVGIMSRLQRRNALSLHAIYVKATFMPPVNPMNICSVCPYFFRASVRPCIEGKESKTAAWI